MPWTGRNVKVQIRLGFSLALGEASKQQLRVHYAAGKNGCPVNAKILYGHETERPLHPFFIFQMLQTSAPLPGQPFSRSFVHDCRSSFLIIPAAAVDDAQYLLPELLLQLLSRFPHESRLSLEEFPRFFLLATKALLLLCTLSSL